MKSVTVMDETMVKENKIQPGDKVLWDEKEWLYCENYGVCDIGDDHYVHLYSKERGEELIYISYSELKKINKKEED